MSQVWFSADFFQYCPVTLPFLYTYKIIVLLAQAAYSYFSAGYRLKNIIVFVMVTLSLMTLLKEGFTNDLNQADYQTSRCD